MSKVLLLRLSSELSARLTLELARAGYEAFAPERTDVASVREQQPDLILLQTDVATLDCCGLLTQLKGNQETAPVKIILLASGGALERSRALDLGADDVVSIPFESAELFARIRAQLREKAPDDRLRAEVAEARRRGSEAEAELAAVLHQDRGMSKRWVILCAVLGLIAIGVVLVVRNAEVANKSNARLAMQVEKLRAEVMSEGQLLARAQKSRDEIGKQSDSVNQQLASLRADSNDLRNRMGSASGATLADIDTRLKETDSRIGKLETESRIAQQIVHDYTASVCLIHVVLGFHEKQSGATLRFSGVSPTGGPLLDAQGNPLVTTEGDGRPVHLNVFGTGFLIDDAGHILTNHHVLEPWWHNEDELPTPPNFEAHLISMDAYFPGSEAGLPLKTQALGDDFDLGLASVSLPRKHPKPLTLERKIAPASGSAIVLIGYPTGIDAILARIDDATLKQISQASGENTEEMVKEVARRKLIRPLATQGHLGEVGADRLVYDAQTTSGGSGGPVFNTSGKVIGVNFAMLTSFSGSNFAVPITRAGKLLEPAKTVNAAK